MSLESIIRDSGSSGRTYKSALLFAVPESSDSVRDAARNLLAWEDIDDDEDTKKRVDEGQLKLLQRNLASARRDLDEQIFRAYRHVYLLGTDNKIQHIPLGQITSSSAGSLVELILRELGRVDIVSPAVGPNKLLKYWPPAIVEWSTKGVRDAFFSSPQLPRLLNVDSIKRTIADGVTQGLFGYASKDFRGQIRLEKMRESLFDADVDISDDTFILKAKDAQKLLEPPRPEKLSIRPENVIVKVGEQVEFSCAALDQYGHAFELPPTEWSAAGGTITSAGLFTAGQTGGVFAVRATAAGQESQAEIRIRTKDEPSTAPAPPGEQILRWRGIVPTQKWMNFYTKVLTRFASSTNLKLEVAFEVPIEREQAKAKADDTRAGLKELGLDDSVSLG